MQEFRLAFVAARRAAAYLAVTALLANSSAFAAINAWSAVGPEGGFVADIEYHRTSPSTIYVAGASGFYRSTNGGGSWQLIKGDFLNSPSSIVVDPTNADRLYLAVQGEAVFQSSDGGATVTPVGGYPPNLGAFKLGISGDGNTLYAAAGLRIHRSIDKGQTWLERTVVTTDPAAGGVFELQVAPNDAAVLYAATQNGLFKSIDGGGTWQQLNSRPELADTVSLAINPQNPQQLLAGTVSGVAISNDGGTSWTVNSFVSSVNVVAIDPLDPTVWIVASFFGDLFRSTDGGAQWLPIPARQTAGWVTALAINPATSDQILVGGVQGLSLTDDAGAQWSARNSGYVASHVRAFAAVTGSDRIYMASVGGVHYLPGGASSTLSVDNSALTAASLDPRTLSVRSVLAQGGASETLLAGLEDTSLVRSVDGGASWALVQNTGFANVANVIVESPVDPLVIYAGLRGGVHKSIDGGLHWALSSSGLPANVEIQALTAARSDATVVYAGTLTLGGNNLPAGSGVYRSSNGGATWSAANTGIANQSIRALAVDPTDAQTIYACTDTSLAKSTDGGASWGALDWWLPGNRCVSVTIDPTDPRVVYAGNIRVARSIDRGATWETLKSDQTRPTIDATALIVDPQRPHVLIAATTGFAAQQISIAPDLVLTESAPTTPLPLNAEATYTYTATNQGPFHATGVRFSVSLPAGATGAVATIADGQCTNTNAVITCTRDALRTGASASVSLRFTPTTAGAAQMLASLTAAQPDAVSSNNSVTSNATAATPPAPPPPPQSSGGGGGGGGSPSPFELLFLLAAWQGVRGRRRGSELTTSVYSQPR